MPGTSLAEPSMHDQGASGARIEEEISLHGQGGAENFAGSHQGPLLGG